MLGRLEREDRTFYLAPVVIQEVLQGARDGGERRTLAAYLTTQLAADVEDPVTSRVDAARIYFDCRRNGFTGGSSTDCLIAHIALERGFSLLHADRDFDAIGKVRRLKTLP